ncbi:pre-mRNA 3'-end-processing factor FIP1 isoform X2 [Anabrus simplex]|uniref:pre-mRNA 3'-end-processing factor FIP1 isoform X2 n=1 Tax=Anabrus simplex TaxID=316456 RepID=UPI0034DDB74F
MADDSGNEDQWLYGDSNPEQPESENKESKPDTESENAQQEPQNDAPEITEELQPAPVPVPAPVPEPPAIAPLVNNEQEEGQLSGGEDENAQLQIVTGDTGKDTEPSVENQDDDDEDSDDDVQVVIGDIKTSPTYTSLNIKRGGLLTSAAGGEKLKQPGKFSIEEFEAVGTINGVPAHEFNLDSLEDKPWRKPGADITDYFNYGFNEETWRAYCERQKRIRVHESGVGLAQIGGTGPAGRGTIPVAITNDNSKYSGFMGPKKAGPPPGRKMGGTIDVIGGGGLASRRNLDKGTPPKENVIQVMTADRREYSRKPTGFPDMSVPPPPSTIPVASFELPPPPHGVIPPIPTSFPPPHMDSYGSDFYGSEADSYYNAYEPTQDSQWNDPVPSSAPQVTPLPPVIPPLASVVIPINAPDVSSQDSRGSVRDMADDASQSGVGGKDDTSKNGRMSIEKEGKERSKDKDREKSERHRDRVYMKGTRRTFNQGTFYMWRQKSHRHRSRSRSTEKRSRRHKSRSRSPGHRSHRKKKSRRSDREKSKEGESE